jgi:multiple sugar transport system ATP-binding protein
MADVRFVAATRVLPGAARPAVDAVDLHVRDGELMVLGGAPGSGKSTLLRMLAGLEPVDSGQVAVGGARAAEMRAGADAAPSADRRRVSLVYEGFELLPNLTLFDNIALPLLLRREPAADVADAIARVAGACGLGGPLSQYPLDLPFELRLRAILARAAVRRPHVVCLDEPLAGPEAVAGGALAVVREAQRALGVTMIYATCRSADASAIADRVAVLHEGKVHQVGRPRAVFEQPETVAVARFAGPALVSLLAAPVLDGAAWLGPLALGLTPRQLAALRGERALIGLNPARLLLLPAGPGIAGTVVRVRRVSRAHTVDVVATVNATRVSLEVARVPGRPPAVGDSVLIGTCPGDCTVYDPYTGRRLPA